MKKHASTSLAIGSGLILVLILAIWSPVRSQSAETPEGKMTMENKMMQRCQQMEEHREKMMSEMKAQNTELSEQVATMNSAPQDKKLDLMAAIVTRMVKQQTSMSTRMDKMQGEMMQHMMQHMQMGKDSMSQCPMMKGMTGKDETSTDTHKDHH